MTSLMARASLALALFALAAASPQVAQTQQRAEASQLTVFRSQEGGFEILLPGEPKYTSETVPSAVGNLTNHVFLIDMGSTAYAVMYADYPATGDPSAILQGVRNGARGSRQELAYQPRSLDGHPGHSLVVADSALKVHILHYLVGRRLYQVMYAGPAAAELPPQAAQSLDSFKLIAR